MTYTTLEYLAAIQRELGKRATTYPKIIEKRRKQLEKEGRADDGPALMEILDMATTQRLQYELLEDATRFLADGQPLSDGHLEAIHQELLREMTMRKKCYNLFVWRKYMTKADADEEKRVWKALCDFWQKEYVGVVEMQGAQ